MYATQRPFASSNSLELGQVRVYRPQHFRPLDLNNVVQRGLRLLAEERKKNYPVLGKGMRRSKKRHPANIANRLVCLLSLFQLGQMPAAMIRQLRRTVTAGVSRLPFARLVLPAIHVALRVPAAALDQILKGLKPDDRYVHVRDVLAMTEPGKVKWRRASRKLRARSSFGPGVSDTDFLRNLKRLDGEIFYGRHRINQLYSQPHGTIINAGQRWLRKWIAKQEKNPLSVYYCHRGLVKAPMSWWR